MATTTVILASLANNLFEETALGATIVAVKASSATVKYVTIDNTANASASYLKLYNVASGSVTVGTTAPDAILLAAASTKVQFPIPDGWVFGTALSVACLTAGGTAGTTAPTSSVIVRIAYT